MKIYSKLPRGVVFVVGGRNITINGSNTPGCLLPDHGVTSIPDDYWEELKKVYGKHKAIRDEHIFAAKDLDDAEAIAEEREEEKTGLEQLNPNDLKDVKTSDDKTPEIAAVSKKAEGK
ncbi:MAG TPA: hypothetical protein VNV36_05245 [Pseudomonas sp.]|uniref:hypothetical protein n=1 Tax=Pseudomonas sp. TaxID=306 RepID=UPI002BB3BA0A|nr:hypothetical protein [Pseudomonas sp.]HWH86167.1 hypothetical protein [Pseudomonas sp.]